MQNMVGRNFSNLAQRIIYSYAATFPQFIPLETRLATKKSQQQMYDFMRNISWKMYSEPEWLGLPVQPDDAYQDWELQNQKPKLIDAMRKCARKIDDFYILLLKIGELGNIEAGKLVIPKEDLKLAGKTLIRLKALGLISESNEGDVAFHSNEYDELFPAWKLLAKEASLQKNPVLYFARCMFDASYPYTDDIFEWLVDDKPAFHQLQEFFRSNGYIHVTCRENEISLDWYKNYGKEEEPLKASWAEREHGGISICFDYKKKNQIVFGLRVPKYRQLLDHFEEMDDRLKAFVISKTKKCDGCGYCTQTDKTGIRKPQTRAVSYHGEFSLCSLFPGFSYVWPRIDEETVSGIISFLTFTDRLFAVKK